MNRENFDKGSINFQIYRSEIQRPDGPAVAARHSSLHLRINLICNMQIMSLLPQTLATGSQPVRLQFMERLYHSLLTSNKFNERVRIFPIFFLLNSTLLLFRYLRQYTRTILYMNSYKFPTSCISYLYDSWGPPRVKVRGGATKEVGLSVRLECY